MERVEVELTITNALGLHARPAAALVKVANRYPSVEIEVECEGQVVNGKSIMGVLMLAAPQGMKIKVRCAGDGARRCVDELTALANRRFDDPR